MLTKKMRFSNECFNSISLVFYVFRTTYVLHQEDYIVDAAVYDMIFRAFMQAVQHVGGCVQYVCMKNI